MRVFDYALLKDPASFYDRGYRRDKKGDPDLRRCILEGTENSYGSRGIC